MLRLVELPDLVVKHIENTTGGIAGLEAVSEWVVKEIVLGALLVGFQSIVENWLEFGRCGCRVRVRHNDG